MRYFISHEIVSLLDALPDQFLWLSGWLFIIIGVGGIVLYFRLIKDNHQTDKKMLLWSALGIVAGAIAVFMPDYRIELAILMLIIVIRILAWLLGWFWSMWL